MDEPSTSPSESETDLLVALVRARYGDRLGPAELEDVKNGVEAIALAARALRAVRLDPSDEPLPPFSPVRGDS